MKTTGATSESKPQCVHIVGDHQGNWTHFRQCEKTGTVDVDGYLMCKTHAKVARTRGRAHVFDPGGRQGISSNAPSKVVDVKVDGSLAELRRKRWDDQERERRGKDSYYVGAKWRKIAEHAIKRLGEGGHDLSEFAVLRDAHPDDVERLIGDGADTPAGQEEA